MNGKEARPKRSQPNYFVSGISGVTQLRHSGVALDRVPGRGRDRALEERDFFAGEAFGECDFCSAVSHRQLVQVLDHLRKDGTFD